MDFKLVSDYAPMGDQPEAIGQLVSSIEHGSKHNTLLGVTGSGKTFTVANVIARLNRPTLVLSHNKTLAAQLYGEFKNFFPENAVEYFVSYYDYYQPEAYLPSTDTYIEKDLQINAEIEKMRLGTVATLLSGRRDVIVVSSVSCLYGAGNPADFHATAINIKVGQVVSYKHFLYKLVEALYTRTERELEPATFRVNGDTVDIMAAFGVLFILVSLWAFWLRKREVIDPRLLKLLVWFIPLPYFSIAAGWAVAEIGRQPWIVFNLMRTSDAVSPVSATDIAVTLAGFIIVYSLLGLLDIILLVKNARKGPAEEA